MIHNSLFNPRFGRGLAPALVSTLTELRRCDLPELALGHHPIDGDNIFMDVMTLTTVPAAENSDLLLLDIKRHPQTLHMTHGMFAIFFQMEAHKTGCLWQRPQHIKKAVVRIHHRLLL